MDLISAVDQFLLADEPLISLHPINCLHTIDRVNTCDVCVRACPVDAISLQDGLHLDSEKCMNCGLCLRLCPVGVFRGDDGVEGIFRCIQLLGKIDSIELCCNRLPSPEFGPANIRAALKTDRCLGSFGPSVFLSLFMMGIFRISIRLEICSTCRLSRACQHIMQTAASVNAFFSSSLRWQQPVVELAMQDRQPDWTRRVVIDVKRPPMSRRSFFTNLLSQPGLVGIGRFVNEAMTLDATAPQPSREQQRLAKALSLYDKIVPRERLSCMRQFLPIFDLQVTDNCDACGVCATICRTGALDLVEDKNHQFKLLFSPTKCVGCGVCRDYCEAGAISLKRGTEELIADKEQALLESHIVISGELLRCERCHAYFRKKARSDSQTRSDLCSVCDFRRSNPFGFSLPRNTALLQKSR